MLVLAIDTSSAAVTAAVVSVDADVRVLAARVTVNARAHGELLAPSIERSLAEAGYSAADLDAVVAGVGPGPFTGLRVGLVTATVLADSLAIPAYGLCSLDAMATAHPSLLVAGDARRREVYWARYEHGVRVDGPHVGRPAEVPVSGVLAMTGAGARLYQDVIGLPLLEVDYPVPLDLVLGAAERVRTGAPSEALTPLYLRRPDATVPASSKAVLQ